jgi:hypothetical protein
MKRQIVEVDFSSSLRNRLNHQIVETRSMRKSQRRRDEVRAYVDGHVTNPQNLTFIPETPTNGHRAATDDGTTGRNDEGYTGRYTEAR